MTQTPPGETKAFRFKALNPGLMPGRDRERSHAE
jgi:hypothetical protein